MGGFISAEHHAMEFVYMFPTFAQHAPLVLPVVATVAGGFSQAAPSSPGSWAEFIGHQAGDWIFDQFDGN